MNGYELPITYMKCEKYAQKANSVCDYSALPRPYFSIAYILEGRLETESAGKKEDYRSGDILFIPRSSTYISRWRGDPQTDFISIHFDTRPFAEPFGNKSFAVQKLCGFEDLREDFLFAEKAGKDAPMLSAARLYGILHRVTPSLAYTGRGISDPRILEAMATIENSAERRFTVDELAEMCSMSTSHFYRRFKEQTGVSPVDHRNRVLTSKAARLLCDFPEMSIEEVSSRLGFESSAYFRRLFKAYAGYTPRDYRRLGNSI